MPPQLSAWALRTPRLQRLLGVPLLHLVLFESSLCPLQFGFPAGDVGIHLSRTLCDLIDRWLRLCLRLELAVQPAVVDDIVSQHPFNRKLTVGMWPRSWMQTPMAVVRDIMHEMLPPARDLPVTASRVNEIDTPHRPSVSIAARNLEWHCELASRRLTIATLHCGDGFLFGWVPVCPLLCKRRRPLVIDTTIVVLMNLIHQSGLLTLSNSRC